MFKKVDDKAQGSMLIYMMLFMLILILFTTTGLGNAVAYYFGLVLTPAIGFNGEYPLLTIVLAGLVVVTISSLLTNFFTDWEKMGESQQVQKEFSKEMQKARKEGNQNRLNKLMKMQPEIMKKQQEASSGSMKSMFILFIFILPIFIWLRTFLPTTPHYYFTVPWAQQVSFFSYPFNFGQAWLWIYLLFSMVIGQVLRNGFKFISWTDYWKNIKKRIIPSLK